MSSTADKGTSGAPPAQSDAQAASGRPFTLGRRCGLALAIVAAEIAFLALLYWYDLGGLFGVAPPEEFCRALGTTAGVCRFFIHGQSILFAVILLGALVLLVAYRAVAQPPRGVGRAVPRAARSHR